MADAKKNLEKSNSLKDNSSSKNNLAGIALMEGDRALAKKLLGQARGGDVKRGFVILSNTGAIDFCFWGRLPIKSPKVKFKCLVSVPCKCTFA